MKIDRPHFISVPLATGLQWRGGGGWLYTEKKDGVWNVREERGATFAGELLRNGEFWAFDCLGIEGRDLRPLPRRDRWTALHGFAGTGLKIVASGQGGEFLETVLTRGGEGVVASFMDAPFDAPQWKCKRVETFDLWVVDKAAPSIRLATVQGEDRGWCCARAAFDEIKIGDVAEVAAYGLTAKGRLREPRFVKLRPDKLFSANC